MRNAMQRREPVMDSNEPFLYTGQSWRDIPRSVANVKVDPSVKVIDSFQCCEQLTNVDLCDGLEIIDVSCFHNTSIKSIIIPSTVVVIGQEAFMYCKSLTNVKLCEGLERIDCGAFQFCSSLEEINIPNTVKTISDITFWDCSRLKKVELNEGLIEIQPFAFEGCTSLASITIPSSVNFISNKSFFACTRLARIEYCAEIQQFVSEVPLLWWNGGVSMACLMTYSFLRKHNISSRLSNIKSSAWKNNIHVMLQLIPENLKHKKDNFYRQLDGDVCETKLFLIEIDDYYNSVESRLSYYEYVQDAITALEQGIMKVTCHDYCGLSMCAIIIPNVLSFILDESNYPNT